MTSATGGVAWFRFGHQECFHTFRSDDVYFLEALLDEKAPCPIGGGGGYILFVLPSGMFALLHEQWIFLATSDSFSAIVDAMLFNDLEGCRVVPQVEAFRPD